MAGNKSRGIRNENCQNFENVWGQGVSVKWENIYK